MDKNQAVIQELTSILERKGVSSEEIEGMVAIVHPVDFAFILEDLSAEEKIRVFRLLDLETAAAVLAELDEDSTREVVNGLGREEVRKVIGAMSSDDAAATVRMLAEDMGRDAALDLLQRRQKDQVKELLRYGEETAGALMTTNCVSVRLDATAAEGLKTLQGAVQANTVVYVYVVDAAGVLRGVLSIRSLLRAAAETGISEIMKAEPITVPPEMDQEEVARIVKRYSLEAVPVTDPQGKLLGVVTAEAIMDILEQEAGEDLLKMAGAGGVNVFADPVVKRVLLRIPWLIPPLLGGLFVGKLQHTFAELRALEFVSLVLFIPVMMGTAGNVAVQSSTLIVRGLATGEIKIGRIASILYGELRVGALIGLVCGALIGASGLLFVRDAHIGLVVGASMFTAITAAAVNGTAFPLLLHRLKQDPAISAGPFITALNDITATLIYMGVSFGLLRVMR
ncbi:MAG: magnesium transporter [Candidatus Brocadiae bacterium]|nr:magnesium transporter [Candidatus Brocadiia bacterium]